MKDQEADMGEDDELAARMRSADPAADLSPLDADRLATLLEETMSTDQPTDRSPAVRRWLPAAAAAVLVVAGLGIHLGSRGDEPRRPSADVGTSQSPAVGSTVTELTAPEDSSARCMAPSPDVLGNAAVAFDGVVTGTTSTEVTLEPTRWFTGNETDTVVVRAPSEALRGLLVSVDFREGGRYLVAANDGSVMLCGLSGTHTQDLEKLYRAAFRVP